VDIAAELAVGQAIDADIDHDCAGLDPIGLHEFRLADTRDDDVRLTHEPRQVARRRMTDGYRATRHQQLERHRTADDVRLPDDHRVLADEVFARLAQQAHAAPRRAW